MRKHVSLKQIKVGLDFGTEKLNVGRIAIRDGRIYFEYDTEFVKRSLDISPIRLPRQTGLQAFNTSLFDGLPGVFNDSLPDGWGRLLFDRWVKKNNLLPSEFSPIDRLAYVGLTGLGALTYEPDYSEDNSGEVMDLDLIADQTQEVLGGKAEGILKDLIELNGSSTGARPKALIGLDQERQNIVYGRHNLPKKHEHWLVKFPNTNDGSDSGAIEYVYALMAEEAGVEMTAVHLFSSDKGAGFFATKRFDRIGGHRLHAHTASGLLHSDFRFPSLDYENLLELTSVLTRDVREVEKMFRLAVFNVLSHNRDDHGKNFTFLMDKNGDWKMAPAYDLTFSSGPRGHQSTMVMGEGQAPSIEHLVYLGKEFKLKSDRIDLIIEQTKSALSRWNRLASRYGVSKSNIQLISDRISF